MHTSIEKLRTLSIRPTLLSHQLHNAQNALRNYPATHALSQSALDTLVTLADLVCCIAGNTARTVVSGSLAYLLIQTLFLAQDGSLSTEPGPWFWWDMLLAFNAKTLVLSLCVLAVVIGVPIAYCRSIAQHLYHLFNSEQNTPVPVFGKHIRAAAIALIALITLTAWRIAPSQITDCDGKWQPHALGQHWWRLVCSPDDRSASCTVKRNGNELSYVAGHVLLVPAQHISTIEFCANGCVEKLELSAQESVPIAARHEPVELKISPETLRLVLEHKIDVSSDNSHLDSRELIKAVNRLADKISAPLTVAVHGSVKTEVSGNLATEVSSTQLSTSLQALTSGITDQFATANRIAAADYLTRTRCEMLRRGQGLGIRAEYALRGNNGCRQVSTMGLEHIARVFGGFEEAPVALGFSDNAKD
jgi:hypothetical protein